MENDKPSGKASPLWKHGFLVLIIYLVGINLVHLLDMIRTDYPYEKYSNIVVSLMLLLNHIAFFYTTKGLAGKIMKIIAFAWLIIGGIYIYTIAFRGT
jgi:hypothetical protein